MLRRPGHPWPLLLAANRDEMADRPWRPPARHWPDRPDVIAGLDVLGGGTWLGVNDAGRDRGRAQPDQHPRPRARPAQPRRAAAGRPRPSDRVRAPRMRSRGSIRAPIVRSTWSSPTPTPPICVRCHRRQRAEWPAANVSVEVVPAGLSMITAYDRNDLRSPRIRRYLPQFAPPRRPDRSADDWSDWIALLAARDFGPGGRSRAAP